MSGPPAVGLFRNHCPLAGRNTATDSGPKNPCQLGALSLIEPLFVRRVWFPPLASIVMISRRLGILGSGLPVNTTFDPSGENDGSEFVSEFNCTTLVPLTFMTKTPRTEPVLENTSL